MKPPIVILSRKKLRTILDREFNRGMKAGEKKFVDDRRLDAGKVVFTGGPLFSKEYPERW